MSGDNFSVRVSKSRGVLQDLTNRPPRRKFWLITDGLGLKYIDRYGEKVGSEAQNSDFSKQVCIRVESLPKKRKLEVDIGNLKKKQSCNVSQENVASLYPSEQTEIKEPKFVDDSVELVKDCALRDSCTSSGSIATSSGPCKKGNGDEVVVLTSDDTTSNLKVQGFAVHVGPNVDKDHSVGSLPTSNCDSVEWSKLPESQESISFGFTRCTTLKSGGKNHDSKGWTRDYQTEKRNKDDILLAMEFVHNKRGHSRGPTLPDE